MFSRATAFGVASKPNQNNKKSVLDNTIQRPTYHGNSLAGMQQIGEVAQCLVHGVLFITRVGFVEAGRAGVDFVDGQGDCRGRHKGATSVAEGWEVYAGERRHGVGNWIHLRGEAVGLAGDGVAFGVCGLKRVCETSFRGSSGKLKMRCCSRDPSSTSIAPCPSSRNKQSLDSIIIQSIC